MKKYLFIIILIPFLCFAQDDLFNFEQNVNGVITTSEGIYLILEQGFIQIDKADIYTEYYRQIYNDSTLISPNTEIKSAIDLDIIPFIMPNSHQKRIDFAEPLKAGFFLELNQSGKLNLTSNFSKVVDSLNSP